MPDGLNAAAAPASAGLDLGFRATDPAAPAVSAWLRMLVGLAWLALLAAIVLFFILPDWTEAQVKASDGLVLNQAHWSVEAGGAEQLVTLPHRASPFEAPTTNRYRLAFMLPQALSADQRLGLCVARWALSADVWLDGQRIASALQGFSALLEWNRPHYLALPPALAAGPHALEFRVAPAPRGLDSGLSALWLGDDQELRPGCEALTARQREQPSTLRGALIATGLIALVVGLRLRDPVSLWIAALAGVWTVQHLSLHMAAFMPLAQLLLPISPQTLFVVLLLLRFAFVLPLTIFCLRYLGLRLPNLERAMWFGAMACAVLLAWLPPGLRWAWVLCLGSLCIALLLCPLVLVLRHAWRHASLASDVLSVSLLFLLLCNVVEGAQRFVWIPGLPVGVSQIAVPMIIGMFGLLLAERLWLLYRRQQGAADGLTAEVERQRAQLQHSFEQLRQQRDAEVEAGERLRITRELHDGLGSHLIAAAALLARPRSRTGERAALAALVERSLQELRSALDAIASDTADVAELLGALRDRLEPVLAAHGIQLDWSVEPLPGTHSLGVAERLDVLRIVQEVFSNIFKHAGRCRVSLQAHPTPQGGSLIVITDDGPGLAAGQKEGVGLPSMRERAQRLGAGFDIGPGEAGGCRMTLSLPAPVPAPAVAWTVDRRRSPRSWSGRAAK